MIPRQERDMSQWKVRDVMTRNVISVQRDSTYRELVDTLLDNDVTAAPVVDDDGVVVGIVSEADLLHRVEAVGEEHRPRIFIRPGRRAAARKAYAMMAAELMSAPAVTVSPDASIVAAARQLEARGVKRMPVVDGDGRLVGTVSRRDLLSMHTRPDSEIHHDIVDGIVLRSLSIDPSKVQVQVEDGVVTLDGRVDNRSLAGLTVRMARDVPGVVDVVDKLTWDQDDSRFPQSPGYA